MPPAPHKIRLAVSVSCSRSGKNINCWKVSTVNTVSSTVSYLHSLLLYCLQNQIWASQNLWKYCLLNQKRLAWKQFLSYLCILHLLHKNKKFQFYRDIKHLSRFTCLSFFLLFPRPQASSSSLPSAYYRACCIAGHCSYHSHSAQ